MLCLEVDLSDFKCLKSSNEYSDISKNPFVKRYGVSNLPDGFMMGGNVNLDVNEFIKETLKLDPSQAKINEVYEFFIEIHNSEMDRKLKKCQYKRKVVQEEKHFGMKILRICLKMHQMQKGHTADVKDQKLKNNRQNSYSNRVNLNLIKNTERLKGPQIEKEKLNLNH